MTAIAGRPIRPSLSGGYHRAVRLVSRWAAFYTRDLDPRIAAERRDELASDLWEQGADSDARGASGAVTGASILWRAARGIPADLAWRRQCTSNNRIPESRGWSGLGSFVVAVLIGCVILAFGAVVIARVALNLIHDLPVPAWTILGPVGLGSVLLVCALNLLLRNRTRWLGAAWLAVIAPAVLYFGLRAMFGMSATFQWFRDGTVAFGPSWWPVAEAACLAALGLFYLALSIAWFPPPATQQTGASR